MSCFESFPDSKVIVKDSHDLPGMAHGESYFSKAFQQWSYQLN
jgi:hypothetical protein